MVAKLHSLKETPLMFEQLSPFLDREVVNVAVPRTSSKSIRAFHVYCNLVIFTQQSTGKPSSMIMERKYTQQSVGKPSSMIMDRKYLVILAASKRAR
jgi:hypothetical protein